MKLTKKIVFFVLITFISTKIIAQAPSRYIGIVTSLSSYKGDLSGYEKFSNGFEVSLIQNKDKKIKGILNIAAGSVIAQTTDKFYTKLDYKPLNYIRTTFLAANYTLNYYFFQKEHFKVYGGVGFGIFQFSPKDKDSNDVAATSNNTRPANEQYALVKPILPIQFGVLYTMKNDFGFQLNVKWLNTRTDYLDNISSLANPNDKDNILLIHIGFLIPMKATVQKSE